MSNLSVHLNLLLEVLEKKTQCLMQILTICESQNMLFLSPQTNEKSLFLQEMSKEKQKLIDGVLEYDKVFSSMFESIKPIFEQEANNHLPKIKQLQEGILAVTQLDANIRLQEENSKAVLKSITPGGKNKKPLVTAQYMLKQYQKNQNPKN